MVADGHNDDDGNDTGGSLGMRAFKLLGWNPASNSEGEEGFVAE